jgi:hypothetical protein
VPTITKWKSDNQLHAEIPFHDDDHGSIRTMRIDFDFAGNGLRIRDMIRSQLVVPKG